MYNKILLVDDDEGLISALSLYLSAQGFKIQVATSVNIAFTILDKWIPHLIISDIVMPQQDGYAFLKLLKNASRYKNIPLIFLSAKGMTNDRILGYNLGCHSYLVKPFDPAELLAMIHNILSRFHMTQNKETFQADSNVNSRKLSQTKHNMAQFTFREDTILKCVLQGMTNKEIALELSLSLRNVEKYVSRLLAKTGTRNRTELTQYFYKYKVYDLKGE